MQFLSSRTLASGTLERRFILGPVPGILWTPPGATASAPVPLVLLGHPGGLDAMYPRLVARAAACAADGIASAAIELPGAGDRPPLPTVDRARADLRGALADRRPVSADIIDRLVLPLVDLAVPEWQTTADELLARPELDGSLAVAGGVLALGVRMARIDPRMTAVGLFAGSYIPAVTVEDATHVTIPVHMLLQWDDEGNDRAAALELFDALGTREKTLQANMGGHRGVPPYAGEDAAGFFRRHLRPR